MKLALAAALLLASLVAGFGLGYLLAPQRASRSRGAWLRPACADCPEAG